MIAERTHPFGRAQEWLELLFEHVEEYAILFMDTEGRITVWGEGATRHLGYSADEAVGRMGDFFFIAEDQARGLLRHEMETAAATGRAIDENWMARKDGTRFWASGASTALRDDGGRLVGFGKIFRDLTEKRRAEQELHDSRQRLRLSLAAARMGAWTLDGGTGTQTRDEHLNQLLGLPAVETKQPFAEFFTHVHPDDRALVAAAFERSLYDGSPLNVEFRVVRPDGTVRWLRDQGDLFGEPTGLNVMAGACIDVTERKEAELALQRAHAELEQRVQERTAELARAMEVRQLLAARLVNAQEAERRRIARDLHDSLGQYITAMNLSLKAAREAVDPATAARLEPLVGLAKEMAQEAHRLATELRPRALDDVGLKAAVRQSLEAWSERTKVPVEFACQEFNGERFQAEVSTTVYRVIQESLTNVAKHAGATRVCVVLERTDGQLVVIIEDDGKGFDPEAELARKRQDGGLGVLGMKERAALAGGVLEVESSPGEGTAVLLRIPLS